MSDHKKMGGDNQKTIIIKKTACDKEHLYAAINIQARKLARKTLNGNEYKLWEYLAENQTDYKFDLSSSDFMLDSNVSRPTYSKAVSHFIELGYLVLTDEENNIYTFYDIPRTEESTPAEHTTIIYSEEQLARFKKVQEDLKLGFKF